MLMEVLDPELHVTHDISSALPRQENLKPADNVILARTIRRLKYMKNPNMEIFMHQWEKNGIGNQMNGALMI